MAGELSNLTGGKWKSEMHDENIILKNCKDKA